MSATPTVDNDSPTSKGVRRLNHLTTAIVVALYAGLLLGGLVLSILDLHSPSMSSQPAPGLPAAGSSAGHVIPAPQTPEAHEGPHFQ